jgi:hypothetical protein
MKSMPSVFTKHIADTLKKHEPKISPPTELKFQPAGRLLNWILDFWDEPTISAYQIYTYGPRPIKNLKEAVGAAEVLTRQGWFTPVRELRSNSKRWLIVRKAMQMSAPHANETAKLLPSR